jgi:hypothetical protein
VTQATESTMPEPVGEGTLFTRLPETDRRSRRNDSGANSRESSCWLPCRGMVALRLRT